MPKIEIKEHTVDELTQEQRDELERTNERLKALSREAVDYLNCLCSPMKIDAVLVLTFIHDVDDTKKAVLQEVCQNVGPREAMLQLTAAALQLARGDSKSEKFSPVRH